MVKQAISLQKYNIKKIDFFNIICFIKLKMAAVNQEIETIYVYHFIEGETNICAKRSCHNPCINLCDIPQFDPLSAVDATKYPNSYINNKYNYTNIADKNVKKIIKEALFYNASHYLVFHKYIPEPFHRNIDVTRIGNVKMVEILILENEGVFRINHDSYAKIHNHSDQLQIYESSPNSLKVVDYEATNWAVLSAKYEKGFEINKPNFDFYRSGKCVMTSREKVTIIEQFHYKGPLMIWGLLDY